MAVSDAPVPARAPARHLPQRSALGGLAAAYEHMWLLYRRTWRGSIFSSFAQPALFLLAMGVGLGAFVDQASPARSAACLTSSCSRRRCWCRR